MDLKPRKQYLRETDKAYLEMALQQAGGRVSAAAELIGIQRAQFYRLMTRYGIPAPNPGISAATRAGQARLRTTQTLIARLARPS